MRLTHIVVAVAATLSLSPVPAVAGGEHLSAKVRHSDLNLASADGQRTLDRRVAAAARRVCGVDNTRELTSAMRQRRCFHAALTAAEPAVALAVARTRGVQVAAAGRQ